MGHYSWLSFSLQWLLEIVTHAQILKGIFLFFYFFIFLFLFIKEKKILNEVLKFSFFAIG